MGKIKPIKTGMKQKADARKALCPFNVLTFFGLNVDDLVVYLAFSLEYFSKITNRPINIKSIDASCIAV